MCNFLKATNEVVTNVPKTTEEEMMAAVNSSSKAFESWSTTSILARQQILFAYQGLIKSNMVVTLNLVYIRLECCILKILVFIG